MATPAALPKRILIPTVSGFYWATHRKGLWRTLVWVGLNGLGRLRVQTVGQATSYGTEEFKNYRGPLVEKSPATKALTAEQKAEVKKKKAFAKWSKPGATIK